MAWWSYFCLILIQTRYQKGSWCLPIYFFYTISPKLKSTQYALNKLISSVWLLGTFTLLDRIKCCLLTPAENFILLQYFFSFDTSYNGCCLGPFSRGSDSYLLVSVAFFSINFNSTPGQKEEKLRNFLFLVQATTVNKPISFTNSCLQDISGQSLAADLSFWNWYSWSFRWEMVELPGTRIHSHLL